MKIEELYKKLKNHFLENGYIITRENERGMEAKNAQNGISFDQMVEGEYLESGLFKVSNELLVQYDIFTGELSCDIFVKEAKNEMLAKEWQAIIENEIVLLGLRDFMEIW